jgi:PAS domain S-box-containing protein
MKNYLEFKDARCKDCYKCLRECPVKAIEVINHQAKIIDERCILCGNCTKICPQNAKQVHSEREQIEILLHSNKTVIATIAPSFVSSFNLQDFSIMKTALCKLGFSYAEETAVGAKVITEEYNRLLKTKKYKNFITSACPSANRMIQLYYPDALQYLAPVDSPMIAHAKMLKERYPQAKIIFIGPCIAKKREAKESELIDGVLTFEDLFEMFTDNNINLNEIEKSDNQQESERNKAKYYPINRGIIKSFSKYPEGYEYVAVDGVKKCNEVLENIESLSGIFIELNTCDYACVNGPCSLYKKGGAVKANEDIRSYVNKDNIYINENICETKKSEINVSCLHQKIKLTDFEPTEREINEILARTGKFKLEDEFNCGACGYSTCREKAWAVANGYANIDMCLPYMRERAESMSYEIIQNSPNGIFLLDNDFKILEINNKAINLLGVDLRESKGNNAFDIFDSAEFLIAFSEEKDIYNKKVFINKTKSYVELSVIRLLTHKVMFAVMKDITKQENYDEKLNSVKFETLKTTDEVIKKQMRVAQEIASLLGETTAETKIALLKLKKTLLEESGDKNNGI